jgi:hypothetical protein
MLLLELDGHVLLGTIHMKSMQDPNKQSESTSQLLPVRRMPIVD